MVIFNSYVKLPDGIRKLSIWGSILNPRGVAPAWCYPRSRGLSDQDVLVIICNKWFPGIWYRKVLRAKPLQESSGKMVLAWFGHRWIYGYMDIIYVYNVIYIYIFTDIHMCTYYIYICKSVIFKIYCFVIIVTSCKWMNKNNMHLRKQNLLIEVSKLLGFSSQPAWNTQQETPVECMAEYFMLGALGSPKVIDDPRTLRRVQLDS